MPEKKEKPFTSAELARRRDVSICHYCLPNQGCHVCGNVGYFGSWQRVARLVAEWEARNKYPPFGVYPAIPKNRPADPGCRHIRSSLSL